MTISDPISDMLTRIKNAVRVQKERLTLPSSKIKIEILKILKQEGYIDDFMVSTKDKKSSLDIVLKYSKNNLSYIRDIKRISKPSKRVYIQYPDINSKTQSTVIISTSKGIMPAKLAKKQNLGGEVLFEIF
ncbi:MAG: 30S ribosomal protein S8 [Candidatus Paceibacterota bacterium]|jgi:small subunit ribosomal protein S8